MIKSNTFLIAALLIGFMYGSCNISDSPVSPPPTSYFVVHASPDAPNLDIFGSGGITAMNFGYKRDTGYFFVPPQTYEFKVAPTGTTNYLITAMVPLEANKLYSLFIIDSLSRIKMVSVHDNLLTAGTDTSNVRFLQFSPNAPYLSAELQSAADTLKFENRSFNDQVADTSRATFKPIKSGSYKLALYLPGSSTPFAEFPGIDMLTGKSYTVYLRGFYEGTGTQALDKGVIQNVR